MPEVTSHLVAGKVRDIHGAVLANATVTLTHTSIEPVLTKTTNSSGEYSINLGRLDEQWTAGETITLLASKTAEGRITLETTISSGGGQTHNLTLEETADFDFERQSDLPDRYPFNMAMLTDYAGNKITHSNPLPVQTSNIDLVYNPSLVRTITRTDGNPDSETVTLINGTSYKRTMTYSDPTGALLTRSKWIKQ